jgi:hypothetical protein
LPVWALIYPLLCAGRTCTNNWNKVLPCPNLRATEVINTAATGELRTKNGRVGLSGRTKISIARRVVGRAIARMGIIISPAVCR